MIRDPDPGAPVHVIAAVGAAALKIPAAVLLVWRASDWP
jgi:hypothetical protein